MAVYERMMITHLSLTNFRNYTRLELNLPEGITLLQGDNAQGKTNLLESIYYLATSRSPQAGSDLEVVNWVVRDDPMACVRLVAEVKWNGKTQRLELTLVPANNPRSTSPTFRKRIRVNGVPKRAMDLIGVVNVVIFRPQDIDLVAGAPAARRRYLDVMLCQIDNRYCRSLQMYNRVLSQRNCLLRTLRERSGDESQLNFWDERLIENGAYIFARRRDALLGLDRLARAIHRDVTEQKERLCLCYQPSLPVPATDGEEQAEPSMGTDWTLTGTVDDGLASAFRAALESRRKKEIACGMTLIGPHRDDFRFLSTDVDLTVYGSRGQQRTAALTLKLAETEVVRQIKGHWPILLLDDVMSELDGQRCHRLMNLVDSATQTLITTTDIDAYSVQFLHQSTRYQVKEGRLERLDN